MILDGLTVEAQRVLSDEDVWWKHGQRSTVDKFLSQYTLHDSYWIGVQFQQNGSCMALLKFDVVWINPALKKLDLPVQTNNVGKKHYSGGWPYLCIYFPNAHQILSDHSEKYVVDSAIADASTKILTAEQRASWLELFLRSDVVGDTTGEFLLNENVHCTSFEGTAHNRVYIIHNEPTLFLCVKRDGSALRLPDLELPDGSS
jgi:hypothetical protein